MAERDVFNLIFLPGFSTAEKVTNVSGRGVGMDVVKTNVEKIGGTVDIAVQGRPRHHGAGQDSADSGHHSGADGAHAAASALPSRRSSLTELVRLEADEVAKGIEMVHGAPVYRLRGRLLPLVYLSRELRTARGGRQARQSRMKPSTSWCCRPTTGNSAWSSTRSTTPKKSSSSRWASSSKASATFAGATIMGDGKVALILDVLGLAQRASVVTRIAASMPLARRAPPRGNLRPRSAATFCSLARADRAWPWPSIPLARLEELPASNVEKAGTQWVAQYRGQILPLINLEFALEERRRSRQNAKLLANDSAAPLQVLVCDHEGHTVGLVVERILDIVENTAEVKYAASRPGVLYSTVIDERVTELIDVPTVLRAAGFGSSQTARKRQSGGGRQLSHGPDFTVLHLLSRSTMFGVELKGVQEVIRELQMTPVPLAPAVVSGLMNLRGQWSPPSICGVGWSWARASPACSP